MKKILLFFTLIYHVCILTNEGECQTLRECPRDLNLILNVYDDINNIKQHQIICSSGQVFINWIIKNQEKDCLYLIERSDNGQVFRSIGVKMITAANFDIFYSFVDEKPDRKNTIYRLRKMSINVLVND